MRQSDSAQRMNRNGSELTIFGRNRATRLVSGLAAVLVLLLSGCGEQPFGIFASLEREQEIPDSALSEVGITLGFVEADGRYYLSLGRLFDASTSSLNWSTSRRPSRYNEDGDHAISLATDGTALYAIFRNHSSSSKDLFRRPDRNSGWSRISLSEIPVRREIERVFYHNGFLFLADGSDIYYTNDPGNVSFQAVAGISGRTYDMAFGAPYYWFVVSDGDGSRSLYRTDDHTGAGATSGQSPSGSWFGGVHYIPAADSPSGFDRVYVSGEGEAFFTQDNGDDWTRASRSGSFRYTGIDHYVKGPNTIIVIGTERETTGGHPGGYFLIEETSINRPDDETDRYEGSLLSRSHIQDFYVDPIRNRLFALTYGRGVWRLEYDGNNEWRWE